MGAHWPAAQLGPYRIEAQKSAPAGWRGLSRVRRAARSQVAIKVLHDSAGPPKRLAAEARAAAAIDHRAIVKIHDVGDDRRHPVRRDGARRGRVGAVADFARRLRRCTRARAAGRARRCARARARARHHSSRSQAREPDAHARRLRILDFGLAKLASDAGVVDETEPGTLQGTAGYMAPEQARGEPSMRASESFACGAIAYELATGQPRIPRRDERGRLTRRCAIHRRRPELGVRSRLRSRAVSRRSRATVSNGGRSLAWALRSALGSPPDASARAPAVARAAFSSVARNCRRGRRARLCVRRRGAASTASSRITLRPLTHRNGRVYTARFSRDGARIVYGAQWDDDPLQMHAVETATGATTALDLPPAMCSQSRHAVSSQSRSVSASSIIKARVASSRSCR